MITTPGTANRRQCPAFTLTEVLIAVAVVALFGLAAFATNQRLLIALRSQKETTAATMMLQERMESFRANSYSHIADNDYVKNSILTFNPSPSPSPTPAFPPGGQYETWSEAPLGNLTETITVSGYLAAISPSPSPSPVASQDYNQWTRDTTGDGHPHEQHHNDNLATQYDLLKVDILVNWTSTNGRGRSRSLSAIFGKGNIGP
jgi:prepilin-type N-terminal cleavage/methylation domain-containing protein